MRKAEAEWALIYFGARRCRLKPFVELAKSITLTAATPGTRSHADARMHSWNLRTPRSA